jgi:hypothetical protein
MAAGDYRIWRWCFWTGLFCGAYLSVMRRYWRMPCWNDWDWLCHWFQDMTGGGS